MGTPRRQPLLWVGPGGALFQSRNQGWQDQFSEIEGLPQRQEIERMGLGQTLRMLNYVQRHAKWQSQEDTFMKLLESGLVPALILRMARLTA